MATSKNHTGIFKKILVEFIGQEDPILAMLEWTAQQMMQIEAEAKVGVPIQASLKSKIPDRD